ncbi:MAG TPA: methylmalonyl-CoA epimerase [Oligoflexia bacterium]|nr:methylmalonyl-CoA epimerase [Oligoflexia bacterium]HMP27608.1 methylmalonyl-CoA epimerase [Oligoflexia bacterium]
MSFGTIDHVGVAVFDLEKALKVYSDDFGYQEVCRERLEDYGVEVVFLGRGGDFSGGFPLIEILAPFGENSKLYSFLKRRGEGLHHIAYLVTDIEAELERLRAGGHKLVDLSPRLGAREMLVAFIHPSSANGVLVELCQKR